MAVKYVNILTCKVFKKCHFIQFCIKLIKIFKNYYYIKKFFFLNIRSLKTHHKNTPTWTHLVFNSKRGETYFTSKLKINSCRKNKLIKGLNLIRLILHSKTEKKFLSLNKSSVQNLTGIKLNFYNLILSYLSCHKLKKAAHYWIF